ncbi:MAG TPA: imidazolonepropionase [Chitinophagaceae bacterium]|nr:imidazolonepropionase [Chitinophagaceae bacterium]
MPVRLLITHIGRLLQVEEGEARIIVKAGSAMGQVACIEDAYLLIEGNRILDFGKMGNIPQTGAGIREIDAKNGFVLPSWCDSHTHLVFAGFREKEFEDRIGGKSYAQIASGGGGILYSMQMMAKASERELMETALQRLEEIRSMGTGAVEIKSGYGLSLEGELKMLRVIRSLRALTPLSIKSTFLGAHAFPPEYRRDHEGYIRLITEQMLPAIAAEGLADYMDVFCEKGFFSARESGRLLEAGWKYGLKPKVHANQLHRSGGIQMAVKHKAVSADHLEKTGRRELQCLKGSGTIATLLPASALFLDLSYRDTARSLIRAGIPVALASDYNPGSCPSGNMPLVMSLGCMQLKMTPAEVINAVTVNGAAAMELGNSHGSIARGKMASIVITSPMPSLAFFPYRFGSDLIRRVIIAGEG